MLGEVQRPFRHSTPVTVRAFWHQVSSSGQGVIATLKTATQTRINLFRISDSLVFSV